ncbi:MAG: NAD(P)/FAD-dependent oxidoreductase [Bacillota bacterium]
MKYLILGAGAAGVNAARAIRETDPHGEIIIVSKDDRAYSRPLLHHVISQSRTPEKAVFAEDSFFEEYNIRRLTGLEAVSLDTSQNEVLLSDGQTLCYDRLLIATGASSAFPPIENLVWGKQVTGLRNIEDVRKINAYSQKTSSAVVIGAGLIGMDAAYSLVRQGVKVSVVEMAANILPLQLDPYAAGLYEKLFRDQGAEFFFCETVSSIALDSDNNVLGAQLKSGKFIPCGMVIVAAGVIPNHRFLINTPIETGRGIKVDSFQQTSVSGVYAAGDVCESLETFTQKVAVTPVWPSAVKQGQVAGYNMAGISKKINDNFAYMNSMTFFGIPSISFGLIKSPDNSYRELVFQNSLTYKKFILKDGLIRGAVIQGDISGAGLIGELIKSGIDISRIENKLFQLSYADFFSQKENGEFSFSQSKQCFL